MRNTFLSVTAMSALLLTSCATDGESTPTETVTVTESPAQAAATPEPSPTDSGPSTGPWPDSNGYRDGRYIVGDGGDIPGQGMIFTPHQVFDCAWRVTDANGEVVEEAFVTHPAGTRVYLRDGDMFESWDCDFWRYADVDGLVNLRYTPDREKLGEPLFPGSYVVGDMIPAGEYFLELPSIPNGPCTYSIKERRKGQYFDELFVSTNNIGLASPTGQTIYLSDGDLFEFEACGTWQRLRR